jgi:peptide/nickel transport system substrate-binding protein
VLKSNKPELSAVPSGGWRMISMDTSRPPFDDIDVRKAVIAGFDRNAARQQRGGEALGPIAQHYIPPGMAGFEESNGVDGWSEEIGADRGRQRRARQVGLADHRAAAQRDGLQDEAAARDPRHHVHQVLQRAEVGCERVNIIPSQNSNWPELDVPEINKEIDAAKLVVEPAARAKAWAKVNHDIVAQAPAIPYMDDYQSVVASPNVRGVQNGYSTIWDLSFTSIR